MVQEIGLRVFMKPVLYLTVTAQVIEQLVSMKVGETLVQEIKPPVFMKPAQELKPLVLIERLVSVSHRFSQKRYRRGPWCNEQIAAGPLARENRCSVRNQAIGSGENGGGTRNRTIGINWNSSSHIRYSPHSVHYNSIRTYLLAILESVVLNNLSESTLDFYMVNRK